MMMNWCWLGIEACQGIKSDDNLSGCLAVVEPAGVAREGRVTDNVCNAASLVTIVWRTLCWVLSFYGLTNVFKLRLRHENVQVMVEVVFGNDP